MKHSHSITVTDYLRSVSHLGSNSTWNDVAPGQLNTCKHFNHVTIVTTCTSIKRLRYAISHSFIDNKMPSWCFREHMDLSGKL